MEREWVDTIDMPHPVHIAQYFLVIQVGVSRNNS